MSTDFTKQYTDLLIIQYHNKPKAKGHIEVFASELEKIYNLLVSFEDAFDLDKATGKQLDILGKIVGINRIVPFSIAKDYFGFSDVPNSKTFGAGKFKDLKEIAYTDYELNDEDYRFFIKAKVLKNFTSGYLSKDGLNLQGAIDFLFDNKAYIVDNRDMTFTIYINDTFNLGKISFIRQLGLYPFPCGTDLKYLVSYSQSGTFGFSNNPNSKTFGMGKFAKIYKG